MSIEVRDLRFGYGDTPVLEDISFSAGDGELIAVLGPNGVGKSTFFQCLLGFLKPWSGEVRLGGRSIAGLSHREIAKEIAYIPQSVNPVFNYTVLDTVMMGLTNRIDLFGVPRAEHRAAAMEALGALGIDHLAQRGCSRISGGERQLALIARAIVQNARVILMDEPTANLDYGNSFRVMQRISTLAAEGYTIIFSTHEPNQAMRYASRVIAMRCGRILADGTPSAVLTEETLSALYHIDVAVREVEVQGARYQLSVPFEKETL